MLLSKKARQASYSLAFLKGKVDRKVLDRLEEAKAYEEERAMEIVGGV